MLLLHFCTNKLLTSWAKVYVIWAEVSLINLIIFKFNFKIYLFKLDLLRRGLVLFPRVLPIRGNETTRIDFLSKISRPKKNLDILIPRVFFRGNRSSIYHFLAFVTRVFLISRCFFPPREKHFLAS